MLSSWIANLLLFLSAFQLVVASSSEQNHPVAEVEARSNQATVPSQADLCFDYEWTANMSTIGKNGSYRTVLLQKSNIGTIYNARMMNAAVKKLPALTVDKELNEACGNWTEIAHREAASNYSQGIVAQFTVDGLPVGIKAGPIVIVVVGVIVSLFSMVWLFIV